MPISSEWIESECGPTPDHDAVADVERDSSLSQHPRGLARVLG